MDLQEFELVEAHLDIDVAAQPAFGVVEAHQHGDAAGLGIGGYSAFRLLMQSL